MTIEAGALAIRITEVGGDQVLKKLGDIDAKAKALGQATPTIKFNVPSLTGANNQLQILGATLGKVQQAASGAAPPINNLPPALDKTKTSSDSLTASLGKQVLGFFTARQVWREAVQFYDAVTEASDRQANAHRKLGAVAKLTGTDLSTVNAISDEARTKFRLSVASAGDLTQGFVRLTARAGDVAATGQLMTAWMDLGAANGLTLDETLQALTTTLGGNDEGLNRIGLANPSQIWKKWADAAGTTVGKMTEQQKWLALVVEVTQQGAKVNGEYEKSLDTVQGRQKAFNEKLEDTQALFGKSLDGPREWFFGIGSAILDAFGKLDAFSNFLGAKVQEWERSSPILARLGRFFGDLPPEPAKDHVASLTFQQTTGIMTPPAKFDPEAAKKAEEERIRAIGENIGALRTLAEFHKLTAGDMMAAIVLEQRLTAEYDRGTTSRKRRAEILGELDKLSGIVLARTKLSDLALTPSAPDGKDAPTSGVGLDKDGKMHVPTGLKVDIKTIELHGWEKLAEVVKQRRQEVSEIINTVGQDVGNAFGDAFSAAFTGGNFFEEFGKSLLRSLGNMLVQLGASMLAYGLILAPLGALLSFTPFAPLGLGIGASIAAGTALVALGAGMGALAGGGKGGGGSSAAGPNKPTNEDENEWSVAFDPDRKLRRGSSAVAPVSRAIDSTPLPDKQQPFVFAPTIIGADDPVAQKKIAYMVERVVLNGGARGLR